MIKTAYSCDLEEYSIFLNSLYNFSFVKLEPNTNSYFKAAKKSSPPRFFRICSNVFLDQNQLTSEIQWVEESSKSKNGYSRSDLRAYPISNRRHYGAPRVHFAFRIFRISPLSFISSLLPLLSCPTNWAALTREKEKKREREIRRLNYAELLKYDNLWQIAWPRMNLYLRPLKTSSASLSRYWCGGDRGRGKRRHKLSHALKICNSKGTRSELASTSWGLITLFLPVSKGICVWRILSENGKGSDEYKSSVRCFLLIFKVKLNKTFEFFYVLLWILNFEYLTIQVGLFFVD